MPSLRGKKAVFVAVVEDVSPQGLSEYKARWQEIYHEEFSLDRAPLDRLRAFVFQLWPRLFSPGEIERMKRAKSFGELLSSVGGFWLTPRRIRLQIEEPFAGPDAGGFVLYTGVGGGDCGVDFKVGERWLVDAFMDSAGRWIAHLCSSTLPVTKAGAVLTKLRAERR